MQAESRRRVLERILLFAIVVVLGLIGWRVAAFLRQGGEHHDFMAPNQVARHASMADRPHFIPEVVRDPDSVPGKVDFTYSTNSLGMRDRERSAQKPPDTLRILVVGECVCFGNGVADDEPWPALLEALLAERLPRPVEVLNGCAPARRPMEILWKLRDEWLTLQPDLVIYSPGADSVFLGPHLGMDGDVRTRLTDQEYQASLEITRQALNESVNLSRQYGFGLVLVTPTFNSFGLPDIRRWVDMITGMGQGSGIPVLDTYTMFHEAEAREGLVVEDLGGTHRLVSHHQGQAQVLLEVPFQDTDNTWFVAPEIYAWLDQHPDVRPAFSIDENHPNPRGHQLIAQAMLELLERSVSLEPRPTVAAPPGGPAGPPPPPGAPPR